MGLQEVKPLRRPGDNRPVGESQAEDSWHAISPRMSGSDDGCLPEKWGKTPIFDDDHIARS